MTANKSTATPVHPIWQERFPLAHLDLELTEHEGGLFYALHAREVPGGRLALASGPVPEGMAAQLRAAASALDGRALQQSGVLA